MRHPSKPRARRTSVRQPGPRGRSSDDPAPRVALGWRLLASRAVERAAAADDGAHDGAPAVRARLAGAVVHLEFALHPTLAAARVDVVTARRAAETDAFTEDEPQRFAQPRDLIGAERSRRPQRVDARAPQRLDRVDVPHSGDAALVEQQRLDR